MFRFGQYFTKRHLIASAALFPPIRISPLISHISYLLSSSVVTVISAFFRHGWMDGLVGRSVGRSTDRSFVRPRNLNIYLTTVPAGAIGRDIVPQNRSKLRSNDADVLFAHLRLFACL